MKIGSILREMLPLLIVIAIILLLSGWVLAICWCFNTHGVVAGALAFVLPLVVWTVVIIWLWCKR